MTQTRKEALTDLLGKVEAENKSNGAKVAQAFDGLEDLRKIIQWHMDAFNGSLDAAKALHEAVLPGWGACIWLHGAVIVRHPETHRYDGEGMAVDAPARAWLIAILKALIAQEPDQ